MPFKLYKASAGSGKTYTLVTEYLKIALQNPEQFKSILAITFTNKAAAEMKERILLFLKALSQNQMPDLARELQGFYPNLNIARSSQQILTKILHNYNDFAIMTIDSFIYKIVRSFAFDLNLSLSFEVDMDAQKMLEKTVAILLDKVGEDPYVTEIIHNFIDYKISENKSFKIINDLYKIGHEIFKASNSDQIKALYKLDFKRLIPELRKTVQSYQEFMQQKGILACTKIQAADLQTKDFAYDKSGLAGYFSKITRAHLPVKDLKTPKRFYPNESGHITWYSQKQTPELKARIDQVVGETLDNLRQEIIAYEEQNYTHAITSELILKTIYTMALLQSLEEVLVKYKKDNNLIPIADFNLLVADLIDNESIPFIYFRVGEKYQNYLLDEFQDTSDLQWRNLWPLIENSLANGYCNLAVGDAKQSIYRWRGSDIAIMEQDLGAKLAGIGTSLETFNLQNNYRSQQNIVHFNNLFFQEVAEKYLPPQTLSHQVYQHLEQKPLPQAKGGYVYLEFNDLAVSEDVDPPHFTEYACQRTLEIIQECKEAGYTYGEIAILVRKNSEGALIADKLFENQIPFVSPDSLLLQNSPVINFLLQVLQYFNDAQPFYLFQIAYFYQTYVQKKSLNCLQDFIHLKTPIASTDLTSYLPNGFFETKISLQKLPLYQCVEEIIRIFELHQVPGFLGFLQNFLEIILDFSHKNQDTIPAFLNWWTDNAHKFAVTLPEDQNSLKIMTIHQAKGLEFSTVIMPFTFWDTRPKRDSIGWTSLNQTDSQDFSSPENTRFLITQNANLAQSAFSTQFAQEQELTFLDNLNLLYVAFTRAKTQLYVISKLDSSKKQNSLDISYILQKTVSDLSSQFVCQEKKGDVTSSSVFSRFIYSLGQKTLKTAAESKQEYQFCEHYLSANWQAKLTIKQKAAEIWDLTETSLNQGSRLEWGLIIHQLFSQIKYASDLDKALFDLIGKGHILKTDIPALKAKIERLFQLPTATGTVIDWFSEKYQIKTEATMLTDSGLLRPDRIVFRDQQASIIDYKTGEPQKAHQKQLRLYQQALEQMGYQTQTYLLYFETEKIERV